MTRHHMICDECGKTHKIDREAEYDGQICSICGIAKGRGNPLPFKKKYPSLKNKVHVGISSKDDFVYVYDIENCLLDKKICERDYVFKDEFEALQISADFNAGMCKLKHLDRQTVIDVLNRQKEATDMKYANGDYMLSLEIRNYMLLVIAIIEEDLELDK